MALLEHLQVVASRDGADPEALRQLANPHEAPLLQQLVREVLAQFRREVVLGTELVADGGGACDRLAQVVHTCFLHFR